MRYADGPTCEVEETIAADPAALWARITDITLPVEQSPELQEVRWLDGADGVAVGHRFEGRNRNRYRGEWTTVSEVVEVDPGRRWVWDVHGDDGVMATWGLEIDPGEAPCTLRQWVRLGPGPSGLTPFIEANPDQEGRIVAGRLRMLRDAMIANLAAIKTEVEADPEVAAR